MPPLKKSEYFCSNRFKLDARPGMLERRHPRIKVVEITQAKLVGLLKASIGTINDISKRLIAFSTLSAEQYFHLYREGVTINRPAMPDYFTVAVDEHFEPDNDLDAHLGFLEGINAVNKTALHKAERGEPVAGVSLMLTDPIVGGQVANGSHRNLYTIYTVSMVEAVICERCKMAKEKAHMSTHRLHPECQVETDRARMNDNGMVKIEDINNAIAVRSAGISHEMVSEFWAVYAPSWVTDAIKIYHQNKDYAGMPLDEFLRQMKPDGK